MFLKLHTLKVIINYFNVIILNFKSHFFVTLEKCDLGNSVSLLTFCPIFYQIHFVSDDLQERRTLPSPLSCTSRWYFVLTLTESSPLAQVRQQNSEPFFFGFPSQLSWLWLKVKSYILI